MPVYRLPLSEPPRPTYPQYDQVVELARQLTPRFANPANPSPERSIMFQRGDDWCTAVLGRPVYPGIWMSIHETYMIVAADQLKIDPPLPAWIVEARERRAAADAERKQRIDAAHQRDRDAWAAALAAATVNLDVYSGRHARVRGALHEEIRHAVPRVDVYSGTRTIRTHRAGHPLCESPTRARPLQISYQPDPAGIPATCDRCLAWTPKVRPAEARPQA